MKSKAATLIFLLAGATPAPAGDQKSADLAPFDRQMVELAQASAKKCGEILENAVRTGALSEDDIFDTLYIPIPDVYPPKFNTRYDSYTDVYVLAVEEKALATDPRIDFVTLIDRNGYLPTHNKKYSQALSGDRELDRYQNRTKRIFNDLTGLTAARNQKPFLIQSYPRDTGEILYDASAPVFVFGTHWGAIRVGYSLPETNQSNEGQPAGREGSR